MNQLNFGDLPIDYRQHYAERFNTFPEFVMYWDELSPDNQSRAFRQFSGINMSDHVYQLGVGGNIVSRRMMAYGDNHSSYKED